MNLLCIFERFTSRITIASSDSHLSKFV
ncbi:hypothetical protein AGR7A_Lc140060 [Agrobacterium deltaense NCPPB 1641]|uniref:Uncharacterized protein n=1 Tax=Agrobacterium deltaense NCPPB 1641 TaxID=1183425 RepID=A0A1S7U2E6_9HYPH|nr:hypothetical protein AGR7A_Lc140060 [Agrobacterium deltaense NCPPB 1641]